MPFLRITPDEELLKILRADRVARGLPVPATYSVTDLPREGDFRFEEDPRGTTTDEEREVRTLIYEILPVLKPTFGKSMRQDWRMCYKELHVNASHLLQAGNADVAKRAVEDSQRMWVTTYGTQLYSRYLNRLFLSCLAIAIVALLVVVICRVPAPAAAVAQYLEIEASSLKPYAAWAVFGAGAVFGMWLSFAMVGMIPRGSSNPKRFFSVFAPTSDFLNIPLRILFVLMAALFLGYYASLSTYKWPFPWSNIGKDMANSAFFGAVLGIGWNGMAGIITTIVQFIFRMLGRLTK